MIILTQEDLGRVKAHSDFMSDYGIRLFFHHFMTFVLRPKPVMNSYSVMVFKNHAVERLLQTSVGVCIGPFVSICFQN